MKLNHTVATYALGGAALALAGFGTLKPAPLPVHEAAIHQIQKPGRLDWPSIGEDKTIALGEALLGVQPGKVTIYCAAPSCHDLQLDLDDAMQIAKWNSEFEARVVDSESDNGIFVGPPGPQAKNLISQLGKIGLHAEEVGITDEKGQPIAGLGIIIGKSGANHESR